ncbi:MAG: transposase [Lachnospiraceae bacterium]|nr:transposase [Lachnospiraceae bacterium]
MQVFFFSTKIRYRKAEKKLAREQRRLSKMQKDSNNRSKQKIKLAKLHEKVSK